MSRLSAHHFEPDGELKVPYGKKIRPVVGSMVHKNGAASILAIQDERGYGWGSILNCADQADATFQINDLVLTNVSYAANVNNLWIPYGFKIIFTGAAGSYVDLIYETEEES